MTDDGEFDLQINNVEVTKQGLSVSYVRLPIDVRKNGLIWQHNVLVPFGTDYDDELEAVNDALESLLADVLDDEGRAEPVELAQEQEGDDDDE